jgi:hypothetical protein
MGEGEPTLVGPLEMDRLRQTSSPKFCGIFSLKQWTLFKICHIHYNTPSPGSFKIVVENKVKFTLQQAVKAQRGSTGIALIFL